MRNEFKEFSYWRAHLIARGVLLAILEVMFGIIAISRGRASDAIPLSNVLCVAVLAVIPWASSFSGYKRLRRMALDDEIGQKAMDEVLRMASLMLGCIYIILVFYGIQLLNVIRPL